MTTTGTGLPATAPRLLLAGPGDVVRVAGAVSVLVALVACGPVDAVLLALVLGGLVVPVVVRVPAALDAAYGTSLLLAAWCAVLELYQAVPWLDVVAHVAVTGLVAAVAHLVLARTTRAVPDPAAVHGRAAVPDATAVPGATVVPGATAVPGETAGSDAAAVPHAAAVHGRAARTGAVVVTVALGLALSALWEVGEYVGHAYVDEAIFVSYADTVGDLVAGGVGSTAAGLWLVASGRRRA